MKMGFLTTLGAVIGAVIGFIICSKFRWFGTFRGIVGQYIAFVFVGGLIGSMIVTGIFGKSENKDKSADDEAAYYEEAEYEEDEEYADADEDEGDADEDGSDEEESDVEEDSVAEDEEMGFGRGIIPEEGDGGSLEGEYIIPESSDVELMEADLEGLTAQELTYARNEIYARHGYVFKSDELNDYFTGKAWYEPDESFDGTLTGLEEVNATFISNYQDANGLTYKPE